MSSGFVTEGELAEARKRRQEEWEKVRTADQPVDRPEEPYDGRSLFDRLKEQKMKKDMEYEEAHKLKNLIRGLDDDEVQFLEKIDQTKIAVEQRQMQEDEKELQEFRKHVATLQEQNVDKLIQAEVKKPVSKNSSAGNNSKAKLSQKELLSSGIKRKNGEHNSETQSNNNAKAQKLQPTSSTSQDSDLVMGQLRCVAILPGIGTYTQSSDSELSSGSEEDVGASDNCKYDLVGRRQKKLLKQCGNE